MVVPLGNDCSPVHIRPSVMVTTRMQRDCLYFFCFPPYYLRLLIRRLPSLFDYVDDLFGLWAFKWEDEVFRYLLASVRHVVTARHSGKSLATLHGCSLILLTMVYSRSCKSEVFCARGLSPCFLNIDLSRNWRSLSKLSPFQQVEITTLPYEQWLLGGSRPTEWLTMLQNATRRKERLCIGEINQSDKMKLLELRMTTYKVELRMEN